MDVMDGPAVRYDVTFEPPLVAQSAEKELVRAGWHATDGIVSAHHGIGMSFHDRGAKRGSVRVGKIMRRNGHIFAVAKSFRAAVNGKMLGGRNNLEIFR